MAHAHAPTLNQDKLYVGGSASTLGIIGLVVGLLGLGGAAAMGLTGSAEMKSHFFHSYLAAFCFFLFITLCSIIFVIIQYLARVGWSVNVRRIAERLSMNIFLLVVLFIPLATPTSTHILLHWFHKDIYNNDPVIQSKSGFMNEGFFFTRLAVYAVLWCGIAYLYSSRSLKQDKTGDPKTTLILEKLGAPLMLLMGFSLTFFAFDWIMGLNAHWFSTIFGVYCFATGMLSMFASIVLIALLLKKWGLVGDAITHEHFHDLGKWMFAFTFFWGYVGFSQFMLIWYANLPEETQFYIPRQIGPWGVVTVILLFVHFVIPFPGLLSRHVKRKNAVLAFWAVWALCACAWDFFWLIIPSQWINRIPAEVGNEHMLLQNALPLLVGSNKHIYQVNAAHQSFMEQINFPLQAGPVVVTVLCFVGIGGLYVFSTMLNLRGKPVVPLKDPRLNESLSFENI